jgi:NUMOD4 motif/HNH endonuclease
MSEKFIQANRTTEVWKDIPGFEGLYMVSSIGRVKSLGRKAENKNQTIKEKILCPLKKGHYRYYQLRKGGETVREFCHRLVAAAFIPNQNNYPYINHINGTPRDNRVENLEWCTPSQNIKHAYKNGLMRPPKKQPLKRKAVIQKTLSGEFIKEFESIESASNETGEPKATICRCAKGQTLNPTRYIWEYNYTTVLSQLNELIKTKQ